MIKDPRIQTHEFTCLDCGARWQKEHWIPDTVRCPRCGHSAHIVAKSVRMRDL